MKATIKFDLDEPSDVLAHRRCISATSAYLSLWDVAQEVFRPARKHGYDDDNLNRILEGSGAAAEIVNILEDRFYEILRKHNVDLEDLE